MRSPLSLCAAIVALLCVVRRNAVGQRQELGMLFTRHPQPLAAPLGDEVYFECSLNLPAERFAWRHRPLGSDKWEPFIRISNSSGKTSKHVVTFDDESKVGDYGCIAFYGTSGLASDPARLSLATIEKFSDRHDIEIRVPAGNTVPISCPTPHSVPEAIVQFLKDDRPIENASIMDTSKTMVIENAQPSDSGKYHCSASNYITSQTYESRHKTILTVTQGNAASQAPYFIKQPKTEYRVLRGRNVTLECFGAGYPVPRVAWTKLGSRLPDKSFVTPMGLLIVNVQPSDRGEYDCVWTNSIKRIKSMIILTVVEPPKVVKPPRASTFAEGGELELSCTVQGQPEPNIEWLINGETLMPGKHLEIKRSNFFSALLISQVEKKHAGIVQCVASNEYGSHSGFNLLRVTPKQHIGGVAKSRMGPSSGAKEGHKHTRIGGRRKGKDNKGKEDTMVPPSQPNVTRLSDESVMVRWSVPENNGLPIKFFKVQYRELGQKVKGEQTKWMTANSDIPNHVRSFEVSDLQSNRTYRFRIAAVYSNKDNKQSPNSARFYLNSDGGFESNKMPIPLLTNTEALGPHEVLLLWQNSDHTADIDGFYVYHRASATTAEYIKTTVEGKNATNITISHLQPDTVYEFKVQSFSVDAASEFSKILQQKTKKLVTNESVVPQVVAENKQKPLENARKSNMYAIVGGVLGCATLFGGLVAVGIAYKRSKQKQPRDSSQSQGKPMTNGRVMNGGPADSKINITSNPLAGLDTTEDSPVQPKSGQQPSMEMASFLNGQNNNTSAHNNTPGVLSNAIAQLNEHQGVQPIEQPL